MPILQMKNEFWVDNLQQVSQVNSSGFSEMGPQVCFDDMSGGQC